MTDKFCFECGGTLEMKGGEDRVFTYRRGSDYVLPSEFLMPTCSDCGEIFVDEDTNTAANKALRPQFQEDQAKHVRFLLKSVRSVIKVSNRDLERACGVTPTYLSHVLKGRKEASETLIGLLESFAIHPKEVTRRLARKSAHDTDLVKTAIEEVAQVVEWRVSQTFVQFSRESDLSWDDVVGRVPANDCEAA